MASPHYSLTYQSSSPHITPSTTNHSRQLSESSEDSSLITPSNLSPRVLPKGLPTTTSVWHDVMEQYRDIEHDLKSIGIISSPELQLFLQKEGKYNYYGDNKSSRFGHEEEANIAMKVANDLLVQTKFMANKIIKQESKLSSYDSTLFQKEKEVTTLQSKYDIVLSNKERLQDQVNDMELHIEELNEQIAELMEVNQKLEQKNYSLSHSSPGMTSGKNYNRPEADITISHVTPDKEILSSDSPYLKEGESLDLSVGIEGVNCSGFLSPQSHTSPLSDIASPYLEPIKRCLYSRSQSLTLFQSDSNTNTGASMEYIDMKIPVNFLKKSNAHDLYQYCWNSYSKMQDGKIIALTHEQRGQGPVSVSSLMSGSDKTSYLSALSNASNEGSKVQVNQQGSQLSNRQKDNSNYISDTVVALSDKADDSSIIAVKVVSDSNIHLSVNKKMSIVRRLSEPLVAAQINNLESTQQQLLESSAGSASSSLNEFISLNINKSEPSLGSYNSSLNSKKFMEPSNTPCTLSDEEQKSNKSSCNLEPKLLVDPPQPIINLNTNLRHTANKSVFSEIEPDPDTSSAIQRVMAGEFLYKSSRTMLGQEKRHLRYMWINPQSKELYWSTVDPGTQRTLMMSRSHPRHSARCAAIRSIRLVSDPWSPSEMAASASQGISPQSGSTSRSQWVAHHNQLPVLSIVVHTNGRDIKIKARTITSHRVWESALLCLQTAAPLAFTWSGTPPIHMKGDNLLHISSNSLLATSHGYPRKPLPQTVFTDKKSGTVNIINSNILPSSSADLPLSSKHQSPTTNFSMEKFCLQPELFELPPTTTRHSRRKLRLYPNSTNVN